MKLEKTNHTITGNSPGQSLDFTGYCAGPEDANTTIYLQGATHAGEQPGILILHHFLDLKYRKYKSPKERLRTALVVVVYLVTAQAVREKIGTCSASALTSFSLGSPL